MNKGDDKPDAYGRLLSLPKSWERADKADAKYSGLADELNNLLTKVAEKYLELSKMTDEIYHTVPKKDCPLEISPLSHAKLWRYLQEHLAKHGVKDVGISANNAKPFKENVQEGRLWLFKLRSGDHLYGTIQQRKQQLADKRTDGQ